MEQNQNPNPKPELVKRTFRMHGAAEWCRDYKRRSTKINALKTMLDDAKKALWQAAGIEKGEYVQVDIIDDSTGDLCARITTLVRGGKWVEPTNGHWSDYSPQQRIDVKIAKGSGALTSDPVEIRSKVISIKERIDEQVNGPVEIQSLHNPPADYDLLQRAIEEGRQ